MEIKVFICKAKSKDVCTYTYIGMFNLYIYKKFEYYIKNCE